jgi:hypothetical protein
MVSALGGEAGSLPTDAWDVGLYSLTDAVQYSGIPMSTVSRWLNPRPEGVKDDLVTFDEFVTLLFVRQLRRVRWIRAKACRACPGSPVG